jgi:hypothetical protein
METAVMAKNEGKKEIKPGRPSVKTNQFPEQKPKADVSMKVKKGL